MKLFRKEEGFTLVELMVVVLIIGILVAIAIPVFNAASKSARLRTCQANQRTIEGAVQQYMAADPNNTWGVGIIKAGDTQGDKLIPSYVKDAPQCKETGGSDYSVNASGTVNGDKGAVGFVAGHTHF